MSLTPWQKRNREHRTRPGTGRSIENIVANADELAEGFESDDTTWTLVWERSDNGGDEQRE
ncbi:hypothetical protein IU451_29055 [Nocardia cyriacigeorgica]|uniref:hypothetical protein n=1 Tax=Nocardia cyriacigeorgica TaxID=135487 RepID=UPI001895A268|nr:hypothetical protein [Nocardia cyriacigeorgica]MBF6326553.1 hypothetical protein [Nocardia cyriacigeorgica]